MKEKIFLSTPHLNGKEIAFIKKAIDTNWIAPLGENVDKFENILCDYVGINYSLALSSGTAALHLALSVIGVRRNDYIFCSDLTFVASANAISYLNAIPVFIDSEKKSWNMCPRALELAFEKYNPKAVIVTDIYGQSANYKEIVEICKKKNVFIIEDAAESLGAQYDGKKCGSFGDISILSFNGNKIITTGGGGMLLSNNESFVKKAKKLSTQARENEFHYEHKELGYNYRLSNILAGIGIGQMYTLDENVEKRRNIYEFYKNELKSFSDIEFMPEIKNGRSTFWLSSLIIKNKSHDFIEKKIKNFTNENVEVRPVWKPMHMQPLYNKNPFIYYDNKPVSELLFEHGLCLPSGSNLLENQLQRIVNLFKENLN